MGEAGPRDVTEDIVANVAVMEVPLDNGTYLPLRYSEIWVGNELVRQVEVWENVGLPGGPPKYKRRSAVLR